jgi:homoaconitate hydratase
MLTQKSMPLGVDAIDVVMPVVTGQTFVQVPETLHINFKGTLPWGMSGKDVMLFILQKLKRNTVAFERVVEFSGNVRSLSVDCRFALSNMATEFGAIAGIFPSDEVTAQFLAGRKANKALADATNKKGQVIEELKQGESPDDDSQLGTEDEAEPLNFRGDPDAEYADRYDINLDDITPLIAKWPSPDNVYSIGDPEIDAIVPDINRSIRHLDGCFIGACTTTEEEMILAGLVLEQGLLAGLKPNGQGQRKISPGKLSPLLCSAICACGEGDSDMKCSCVYRLTGSAIMRDKLERLGILDIYRRAGYTIGAPGCAYCLAVNGVDVAAKGSVWLSSQNRNFRNRMGKGTASLCRRLV